MEIEVKVTATTEVAVDVSVTPIDGRFPGPPDAPRYRFVFSDDHQLDKSLRANQLHPLLLGLGQQRLRPAAADPLVQTTPLAPPAPVYCHGIDRVSHGLSRLG
jgi:hypothetical protein